MMSELIKMSLFCNTENLDELSLDQQMDERTSSLHDPFSFEQSMTSCVSSIHERSAASRSIVSHFLATIASARVDLSTFRHEHPDRIFGNDYLQPITQMTKSEHSLMPVKKSEVTQKSEVTKTLKVNKTLKVDKKPSMTKTVKVNKKQEVTKTRARQDRTNKYKYVFGDLEIIRPPYPYRSLVYAAMFLSDREEMTRQDVITEIRNMFEVFQIDHPEWQEYWQRNVLKRGTQWEKDMQVGRAGHFRLKYEEVRLGAFTRSTCGGGERMDDFADNLFAEIGRPEKYEELRMRVEMAKKEAGQKTKDSAKAKSTPEVQPPVKVMDHIASLRQPPTEVTEKRTSLPMTSPEVIEKCPSLRLPSRPCFNDERSDDSLQLSVVASHNDSAHAPTPVTTLPAFGATLTPQIPCFTPTAFVYGVPYLSAPQFVKGSFL